MSTPGLRDRNGLIKGTDFLHLYILGNIALQKRGELLYDMQAQTAILQKLVPAAAGNSYVPLYGPQVSLLFAPLGRMSYPAALTIWLLLNAVIYGTCCYLVWRESARRTMDRAHRSPRLPRVLSPDCMGPDVRSCSPLLHARVSRTL